MAKKENSSYEELIEQALENAVDDRNRAVEAFEKTKEVYDIDLSDNSSMQGLMLLGQNIPKLLDIAGKSNEQIIKLAQLREKEATRKDKNKGEKKRTPFNVDSIIQAVEGQEDQKEN